MKKISVLILIIAILSGFGFVINEKMQSDYKLRQENELKRRAPIDIPDPSIVTIQEVKDNKKPIIAFFYVDWCGYCKRFMPIFGEVAKEYSNQDMVKEYGVQGFPTLFIIDRKINFKFSLSGNVTSDAKTLKKELDNYLNARKNFAK